MTISVSVTSHTVVTGIYNYTLLVYRVPLCSGSTSASFGSFPGRLANLHSYRVWVISSSLCIQLSHWP